MQLKARYALHPQTPGVQAFSHSEATSIRVLHASDAIYRRRPLLQSLSINPCSHFATLCTIISCVYLSAWLQASGETSPTVDSDKRSRDVDSCGTY